MPEHPANLPSDAPGHVPVLPEQVLQTLDPKPGETCFDATLGRGGHAGLILPRLAPGGRYVGVDLDPANIAYVSDALNGRSVRFDAVHASFTDAAQVLADLGIDKTDLLLADLGFASNQMDDPQRGFSFTHDGPLDMRLDPTAATTAADLLNELPQDELADLIYQFGEERLSRPISRKIVEARRIAPMKSTRQLAELCVSAYGPRGRRQKIHPATRTFMALRIAVNDELAKLDQLLDLLPRIVKPGGRAAIISFHSLEDRAVKHTFREWAKQGLVDVLTKKPLIADDVERTANPRSRSAKLRAIRLQPDGANA